MHNLLIRSELMRHGMKNYQLAELLNITETALSRKLRKELPQDEQDKIISVIREHREAV